MNAASSRVLTPPFTAEQTLRWTARAVGGLSRVAALGCLIGSVAEMSGGSGPTGIQGASIGDLVAVMMLLVVACFWVRGQGLVALSGAVLGLVAAWSSGYIARPLPHGVGLGSIGLLLLAGAATCEALWGRDLGMTRPAARVLALWCLGVFATVSAAVFATALMPLTWLPRGGRLFAHPTPLPPDTAGLLLVVFACLGLQFGLPLIRHLRDLTFGPPTAAACVVTEAGFVGFCSAAATVPFTPVTRVPSALALIAAILGVLAWTGVANLPPHDPALRVARALWILLGVDALALCGYGVAPGGGRRDVITAGIVMLMLLAAVTAVVKARQTNHGVSAGLNGHYPARAAPAESPPPTTK